MKIPNPKAKIEEQEPDVLLAMCIWGEARGESEAAQLGVGNVVRNRVLDVRKRYGYGWSGVILKRWQFSAFNLADPNRKKLLRPLEHDLPQTWSRCYDLAARVFAGGEPDNTAGATHYFDDSLAKNPPAWAKAFTATVKLGRLNFYRAGTAPQPAPQRKAAA